MFMTFSDLAEEQAKSLDYKIETAKKAIKKGFEVANKSNIAFSGGKDSTVLWHMIRTFFPNEKPYIIFGNTGVEYPESLKFARKIGKEWGGELFYEAQPAKTEKDGLKYDAQKEVMDWLVKTGKINEVLKADGKLRNTEALENMATPEMWEDFRKRGLIWRAGTMKSYWWCLDQYGFPIMGKAACKLDARRINIDCFLEFSETKSEDPKLIEYYDLIQHVKISQHCCTTLKKEPSARLQKELGIDTIFLGMMASESRRRMMSFCDRGYVYQVKDGSWRVHPMGIWTDDDVWDYIRRFNVPYSPLYNMGYTDSDFEFHNIKRNGCLGCCTDIQFPNNHMSILRRTHPKAWKVIMKRGLAEQLKLLRQYRSNGTMSLLDFIGDTDHLIENRPCAFDSIDKLILDDDTFVEYDSEMEDEDI